MEAPLVSVHMITYNHAPYIAQAIEGVLRQKTNFPFELVIGEDCSTDGTREIVFNFQKKYPNIIKVITSSQNVGAKRNSYRTTKACRGKYIAFCEGDDYWHNPEKLQKQVNYMERHPECGMVHSSLDIYYNESGKTIKDYVSHKNLVIPEKMNIFDILNDWAIRFWIYTCTALVRRNLCEQILEADPYLHQSDHFLMGDTQLWAELSLVSEVIFIPESLATYRILKESVSNSNNKIRKCRFNESNANVKLYLCDKHGLPEERRKIIESAWYYHALRLAFFERNVTLAREIKRKKGTFTWIEWARYYGATSLVCYHLCNVAANIVNLITKTFNH